MIDQNESIEQVPVTNNASGFNSTLILELALEKFLERSETSDKNLVKEVDYQKEINDFLMSKIYDAVKLEVDKAVAIEQAAGEKRLATIERAVVEKRLAAVFKEIYN